MICFFDFLKDECKVKLKKIILQDYN